MTFMHSRTKAEKTLSSKHLIDKNTQASKPFNSLDAVAAGMCFSLPYDLPFNLTNDADNLLTQPTTPPLPNIADVSDTFLGNLVQAVDHGISYIQMPSARSTDPSAPVSKLASSKSSLPSMMTMCGELNHREEDYICSEYHDFTYQDSKCYQREGREFEYLTNATRTLFKEWVELLTKTDYLKWSPTEIQDFFNALSEHQKLKAAGLQNLKTCKFYGKLAVPHQHNPALTVDPSIPSPAGVLGKRKTIGEDGENSILVNQEHMKRQAVARLKTRSFTSQCHVEKSSHSVQNNVFADLVDPQILSPTHAVPLSNGLPRLTPVLVPAFASPPKCRVASARPYFAYATSQSSSSQASPSNSPAATATQSTRQEAAQAPAITPVVFSASQQQPFNPIITTSQPLTLVIPITTAQVAAQHQETAGVPNQPILPAVSLVPVYNPTLTLKSAGIERYPWTQVRQRMWMVKHNKTAADLPAEAFQATYNPAHTGTPENGNLRLLGNMHVTICEVLTYFPLSPTIREISYRLAEAHWEASDIIKYIFWTRNITDNNAIKRSTVHRMLDSGKKWAAGTTVQATAGLGGLDLASGLTSHGADLIDLPLYSLADNVVNHPSGQDAGILTQCIARCRATANQDITMKDAETYARSHAIRDHYDHLRNISVRTEDEDALARVGRTSSTWFRSAGLRLK